LLAYIEVNKENEREESLTGARFLALRHSVLVARPLIIFLEHLNFLGKNNLVKRKGLDLLYFFSRSVLVGPCLIFNTCCHFQQMASQNLISASATASASVGSVSRESEKQPTLRLHFGIISPFWRGLNLVEAMLYGDANIVHCKRAVATLELKLICCKSLGWDY